MKYPAPDNKILHVAKFNDGEALILEKPIELVYYKFDGFIIGTDGLFVVCYKYEKPGYKWEAFGGRKFDIELHDGSIEHCYGQWWDGFTKEALEYIGDDLVRVTANSIDRLKECYVYHGYNALKKPLEAFRKTHEGTVHEYYTAEHIIKHVKPSKLKKLMGKNTVLDIHHCVYKYMFIEGKTYYKYLYSLDENLQHMNHSCQLKQANETD